MPEWDKQQYLVPANPAPLTTQVRTLCVPDDTDWIATVSAAIRELIVPENWNVTAEDGTEADTDAAVETAYQMYLTWMFQTCAGGTMSCEDVANCIESNPDVLQALLNKLIENGYSPNNNSTTTTPPLLPTTQLTNSMLPSAYDCSTPGKNMAIGRALVKELNESLLDVFQQIELITNNLELSAILTDGAPILGTVNNILEFANWVVETMVEVYQAAYDQSFEDRMACAIFCHLETDCSLSLDELITVYESVATITIPDPSDLQGIVDFFLSEVWTADDATAASFQAMLLYFLRFGSPVFEITGWNGLRNVIEIASGWNDPTYDDLCDDCPTSETPNNYWYMPMDFNLGQFSTVVQGTNTLFQNSGWEIISGTTNITAQFKINSFGGVTHYLAGVRITSLRRGSNASGTTDYKRTTVYPAVNLGGTGVQASNSNFLGDGNAVIGGNLTLADNAFPFQSLLIQEGVSGSFVAETNFARVIKLELWGWNHGDVKPSGSVWVSAIV